MIDAKKEKNERTLVPYIYPESLCTPGKILFDPLKHNIRVLLTLTCLLSFDSSDCIDRGPPPPRCRRFPVGGCCILHPPPVLRAPLSTTLLS